MPDLNVVLNPSGVLFGLFCLVGGFVAGFFIGGWVMWLSVKNGWNHPWRKRQD